MGHSRAENVTAWAWEGPSLWLRGVSGASAGILCQDPLFWVADDNTTVLRQYRWDHPGGPIQQVDLARHLRLEGKSKEVDFEAAAESGDFIYWIGSHGRSSRGDIRPNRHRLVMTRRVERNGRITLESVGQPYTRLMADLTRDPQFRASGWNEASRKPPEEGGINLEGLAAMEDGKLWLGFRSPLIQDRAVLISLLNPEPLCRGGKKQAVFGEQVLLDLGGRGIRSLEWLGVEEGYLILGGGTQGRGDPALFVWRGPGTNPKQIPGVDFSGMHPEGLIRLPTRGRGFTGGNEKPEKADGGVRLLVISDESSGTQTRGRGPQAESFQVRVLNWYPDSTGTGIREPVDESR